MKILVIQLARLGDIYMTWPALRGLRRTFPNAEIHLLTRPRFESAVCGLNAVDRHWSLPVRQILEPLVSETPRIRESIGRLDQVLSDLKNEKFDWIINFTFSPASSFLTDLISQPNTRVNGYTRFPDGYLAFADEVSSYFYAQVGVDKKNRVHLTDIFASMINLQYAESDWSSPEIEAFHLPLPERYVVLHVGASEKHKSLSAAQWVRTLEKVQFEAQKLSLVLVGSKEERAIADAIQKSLPRKEIVNLVGVTQVPDLFPILQEAELLIGCDSAPIHMASLTDTPTFNISIGRVNFWETGPKATLSFIYRVEEPSQLRVAELSDVLNQLLSGAVHESLIIRSPGMVSYERIETVSDKFQWDLIQAIYMGGAYPLAERLEIVLGAQHLRDLNQFSIEQISMVPTKGLDFVGPLLDQADEVIKKMSQQVPELSPLINWYLAEKSGVAPGSIEDICKATLSIHQRFVNHLQVYIPEESLINKEEICDGTL